jgi:glutaredoxin 3
MTDVVMYTKPLCPFCTMAKKLLAQKGVGFAEHDIAARPDLRAEMLERAGGRHTVPQIFVGETHVGGFDELYALEREGKLDPLLAAA